MKKTIAAVVFLALVLLGGRYLLKAYPNIFTFLPSESHAELRTDKKTLNGPYPVVRVIDGDTALIDIDGTETRVRFIGIDTPESLNPDPDRNTVEGQEASRFTKNLLTDKAVYLEYDVQKTDDYDRTLAYVYLEDGQTMVQDELLRSGMATTMTIQPNSKYANHFYTLQTEARDAGAGFWGTGFFQN